MIARFARRLVLMLGVVTVFLGASADMAYACCCVPHDIVCDAGIRC